MNDDIQKSPRFTRSSGRRFSSRLSSTNTNQPRTFEERVQWAIKHREVYRIPNAEEYKDIKVGVIEEDDDEDYISQLQKSYERKCEIRRATLATAQANALSEFEDENKNDIDSTARTTRKRPYNVDSDEDVGSVELQRNNNKVQKKKEHGKVIDTPCERCYEKKVACHEQKPKKTICFECREARTGCSFNSNFWEAKKKRDSQSSKMIPDNDEDIYETDNDSETEKTGPLLRSSTARRKEKSTTDNEILNSILSEIRAQRMIWEQASKTLENIAANILATADRGRGKFKGSH